MFLLGLSAIPTQTHAGVTPATARQQSQATQSEDRRLRAIFAADDQREELLNPLDTLYRGERIAPSALSLLFTEDLTRQLLDSANTGLAAAQAIDRRRLSSAMRISLDVFTSKKREEIEALQPAVQALVAVRPLNHFNGLHEAFPALVSATGPLPYFSEADYRHTLALDAAFAGVIDQAIVRMREGLASGVVETRLTTADMIAQIDALLVQKPEDSPFLSPLQNFPAELTPATQAELRAAYLATLQQQLIPAYRRLRDFLANEYLPAARAEPGLSALKGGAGLYRLMIRDNTTLSLEPNAIHRIGLAEVARIQREMKGVERQLGFSGPLPAFFNELRRNPHYHPKTAEEVSTGYIRIAKTVDAQIPRFFIRTPKAKLRVAPYPDYRAKYEAGGSYYQGSLDSKRPGTFFYNTYDLKSRFLTGMTTLYLHEGIPGHHFQVSLALEASDLPDFQRFNGNTAYVEGWALYAETLGYPMGLYRNPMQHWGTLDDEMLRAMRLVVDTGIHAQGWSRERAVAYMLANSGMGKSDAEAEVDRYIAMPAQALAYKLGALTIQRLRAKAEKALGPRFDIRAFHEQVLGSGALPLPILEAKIDRWIEAIS